MYACMDVCVSSLPSTLEYCIVYVISVGPLFPHQDVLTKMTFSLFKILIQFLTRFLVKLLKSYCHASYNKVIVRISAWVLPHFFIVDSGVYKDVKHDHCSGSRRAKYFWLLCCNILLIVVSLVWLLLGT